MITTFTEEDYKKESIFKWVSGEFVFYPFSFCASQAPLQILRGNVSPRPK